MVAVPPAHVGERHGASASGGDSNAASAEVDGPDGDDEGVHERRRPQQRVEDGGAALHHDAGKAAGTQGGQHGRPGEHAVVNVVRLNSDEVARVRHAWQRRAGGDDDGGPCAVAGVVVAHECTLGREQRLPQSEGGVHHDGGDRVAAVVAIAVAMAAVEPRVVGEHGGDADEQRVVAGAQVVRHGLGLGVRDGRARAGGGGDAAVERLRVRERDKGAGGSVVAVTLTLTRRQVRLEQRGQRSGEGHGCLSVLCPLSLVFPSLSASPPRTSDLAGAEI